MKGDVDRGLGSPVEEERRSVGWGWGLAVSWSHRGSNDRIRACGKLEHRKLKRCWASERLRSVRLGVRGKKSA